MDNLRRDYSIIRNTHRETSMFTNSKLSKIAIAVALSVGLSTAAMAQETSSAMEGSIMTPTGSPAAGTVVKVVHVPSGTTRTTTVNENGTFNLRGLRVGGPYQVTVDSDQFQDTTVDGIFLNLGEDFDFDLQLETASDVEVISVSGNQVFDLGGGSSSYFGGKQLSNNTSLNRDIKDVIRANPLVSQLLGADSPLVIAGSNPKFNSITVDGISQNDDFGLNSGGYPTQRSPLPIDALAQVTVDVAPFNAKAAGFSGGLVNAVFKSGTNEWTGSAFFERLSDSMANTPRDESTDVPIQFEEETFGVSIGGPIIKDKLFIFASYEKFEAPQTAEFGAAGSGAPNETDATLAEANEVIGIAQSVYGLTAEQVGTADAGLVEEDEKWIIKLDYNINDDHRASFTYQFNEGNRTRNATNSEGELRLSSHLYNVTETLNNYSLKVYSNWSDNFSTEVSITSKDVENRQRTLGGATADVTIDDLESGGRIAFGSDQFRHANQLDTETFIVQLDNTFQLDDHTINFGVDYQEISIANIFVPGSNGVITFNGIENFRNRLAEEYTYENGTGNNPENNSAIFARETWALYVQDTWFVNEDLTLDLGLRYERLASDDSPSFNVNSLARTGRDNTENLDGIDIFLPRIGVKYDYSEDVVLRGGVGRYTGGQPNVWISNAYSGSGVNEGFFEVEDITVPTTIISSPLQAGLDAVENAVSDGNVDLNDPNFELPNDWRFQIAADYTFSIDGIVDDAVWTNEFLHIKRQKSAFWVDASLQESDIEGFASDGQRIIYADDDNRYDLMLTNADGGRSNIFSTQLSAAWENGVSLTMSYTNQDVTEVAPGTSSTARSNYRFSPGINRNTSADHLGRGRFEIEHRLVLNVSYNTQFVEGYDTDMNFFISRRSGQPVSHLANMDRNLLRNRLSPGFTSGNYLAYIPTANDPNVVYDGVNEADLLAAIDDAGLSQFAGGYAPENYAATPYINSFDIAVTQEVPGFMKGHKGSVYFVFENVLNFIDNAAGKAYDNDFGTLRLYDVDSIDSEGRYVIDRVRGDGFSFSPEDSIWKFKVGVRYAF
ncbi:MAG: hypothetical protein ACJAVV_000817 [Alphaproteobacteria bacterium]|jgi:hypothetical protein